MQKKIIFLILTMVIPSIISSEVTRRIIRNGNRSKIIFYNGGTEIAKCVFDEEGNVEIIGNIPDGIIRQYYDSGNIFMETNYKNNRQDGIIKLYYENGKLMSEGYIKENKSEGISKTYNEDGLVMEESNYKNGKLDGISKAYYESGKIMYNEKYKRDSKIDTIKYDKK